MALFFLLNPIALVILITFAITLHLLYRISPFHPLSHIPSTVLPCLTSLWLLYHAWIGDECTVVHQLHEKYGPIVRTGPNSVDIADGEALHPIYIEKGGFLKASFYSNFDIDGHKSIFSELNPNQRAPRAKAVAALFSTTNLRQGRDTIYACANLWVERLRSAAKDGKPVNVLNLTRGLAVDAVTAYLFGTSYGSLEENIGERKTVENEVDSTRQQKNEAAEISASGMVNSFVAVGRYWYLQPWAFSWIEWLESKLYPSKEAAVSMNLVDEYVAGIVETAQSSTTKESGTYPARFLEAGFSISETRAQCKDLIFAGTDSTGMNLATICFKLVKYPETYKRLRTELLSAKPTDDEVQSLPYLRGVIKEGLRLSMANPSRLARVVPPTGWTFKNTYFPPGTVVSCTPYELHLNPLVFPDPHEFKPERWLNPTEEMNRDAIAFGLGTRQCIARNLATMELFCAVQRVVEEDVLAGAKCCKDKIEILEWFNSKVVGEKIELVWS